MCIKLEYIKKRAYCFQKFEFRSWKPYRNDTSCAAGILNAKKRNVDSYPIVLDDILVAGDQGEEGDLEESVEDEGKEQILVYCYPGAAQRSVNKEDSQILKKW